MKIMPRLATAASLAVALGAMTFGASQAQANPIFDPGFETGPLTTDGAPFVGSWESFSGDGNQDTGPDTAVLSSADPLSGASHLELAITGTVNTFAGVFQDLPSQIPGDSATFSGWSKDIGIDAGGSEIRIEWRDSVNNVEIGRTPNLVPTLTPNGYTFWSVTDTVPAGADTARIVYAIQSFGAGPNQTILVDDLDYVPEPASMALLGLGGLAMLRRR